MEEEPSILITTLWQELRTQGYKGAYSTFSEGLKFYGIRVGKKAGFTKNYRIMVQQLLNHHQRRYGFCQINKICGMTNGISSANYANPPKS